MTRLFDVSVLIAIVDPEHSFHRSIHRWLQSHVGTTWASCPLTENGFVRILSQPSFSAGKRTPGEAITLLRSVKETPAWPHVFWADEYSITEPSSITGDRIGGPNQFADVYLVALALRKGGRFLTFDGKVAWQCVPGATASIIEIPPA